MLTLCLIVRNEEANLPRALGSVREVADETVIVDTGSTDRTVEIAKTYGARVETFAWCDDFAAARNHALSFVKSEWVLFLDADDEFIDAGRVRGLLDRPEDGISVRQEVARGIVRDHLVLFRSRFRYVFRVHEHLPISNIHRSDLRLIHHGYTPELLPKKRERNRRLLELMRGDADPRARVAASYYLGGLCEMEGRIADARKHFAEAAHSGVRCEFRVYAAVGLARVSAWMGDHAGADAIYRALLQSNPGALEAELGLADLYLKQGRRGEAAARFEAARASRLRIVPYPEEPWESEARRRLETAL